MSSTNRSTNRIVINSTTARAKSPVIVIPDTVATSAPAHRLLGQTAAARAFQAVMALGLLGAALHQAFGVGVAMVLTILVMPVLGGLGAMAWASRGGQAENALQTAVLAAMAAPALVFPGALLGWLGAPLWALSAAVARAAMVRLAPMAGSR